MMANNYLIDTHILIWTLSIIDRLPQKIEKLIINPDNQIFYSQVSLLEIAIKKSLDKARFVPDTMDKIQEEAQKQ